MEVDLSSRIRPSHPVRSLLPAILVPLRVTTAAVLPVFLLGGLAVQIRGTLGLSVSEIGVGVAVFFLLSALAATPAGRLVEKTGARRGLQAASALSVISLAGMGASPSFPYLLALLGVGGLGNAAAQVSSNLFLTRQVPISRQGFAFGLKQAAVPAATLLGGLAVPTIGLTIGWRWAFLGAAALALMQIPLIPTEEKTFIDLQRNDNDDRSRMSMLSLIVLASAAALGAMAANALGAFFVDSSVTAGISEGTAGLTFAAGSAAGLAMRIWAGWMADRRTSGKLLAVSALLLVGTCGYLMLAFRISILVLPAAVLCFGGGWGWPGLFNLAVVTQNRLMPALATGITHTGAFTGGIFGPLLFGFIVEKTSYAVAWSVASGWTVLAILGILIARKMILRSLEAKALLIADAG